MANIGYARCSTLAQDLTAQVLEHEHEREREQELEGLVAIVDEPQQAALDHHAAVRALAFKWIRIAFRCWKHAVPYDDARYMQSLRRRGSPLIAALAKPELP